jgi:hypothetical protein
VTRTLNPFLTAPLAVLVYAAVLFAVGGVDAEDREKLAAMLRPRLARLLGR